MARIIYALSGQGRGHTSRSLATSAALRKSGHEVRFCCGGTAREILESQGESVLPVPLLRQVVHENAIVPTLTIAANWSPIWNRSQIITRLVDLFDDYRPDLLITDFEGFSWRAAKRLGIPILSFNHQQVVTETEYSLPLRHRYHARIAKIIINVITPRNPEWLLLTSFFFPTLKRPGRTRLVPPIIRTAVQELKPRKGDHILVYFNDPEGSSGFLDLLVQAGVHFIVYNFPSPKNPNLYPNIDFKPPSIDGFLTDLSQCRAIICTAGFTLISEALFLDKPLLVVPNKGVFEQTLNALFLEREELGRAVIDRKLTAEDLRGFLREVDQIVERMQNRPACGNKEAVAYIEDVLSRIGPSIVPLPRSHPADAEIPAMSDALAGSE